MPRPLVIATVCARGGSKGVPGKNARLLLGMPLIGYTIETALAAPSIDAVYVSTDSPEIAEIADGFGAIVPGLRPAELANDGASKVDAIVHLIETVEGLGIEVGTVVDVDVTSPLRLVSDIEGALALLDEQTDVVVSGYLSDKNPYFNLVEARPDGTVGLVKPPEQPIYSRQSAPPVWGLNGSVYCWHRHTLGLGLWSGRTRVYEMPHDRGIDIDSQLDWDLAEILMRRRKEV
ncbi:MAG: acylneuraminate cytidylyltransferase family protein [Flavobacterium sp.]|nr:acylneuraminate cytidylyltransferase family protein [Aeromicrobium sp.]